MEGRSPSVARTVIVFAVLGALVVVVVGVAGFFVIRKVAVDRAIEQARELTTFSAQVVEQRVQDGIVTGDAVATGTIAHVIGESLLHDPVVHVKLWGPDGTILYSDELKAIGQRYQSGADELQELGDGEVSAEVSDRRRPRTVRAGIRSAARGLQGDPHAGWHAAAVRDVPAVLEHRRAAAATPS